MTHNRRIGMDRRQTELISDDQLTARIEPFDSFWEAPADLEKGYRTFGAFYRHNYLRHLPAEKDARVLVISCGPGYFVELLRSEGYRNVLGIDSAPDKIERAVARGLNCRVARVMEHLAGNERPYDLIFAEQEINHLTKSEILVVLELCRANLSRGGRLVVHSINGASPLTGSESRAGNFDHYNSFTEYSLRQVLEHVGFRSVKVIPLNLYVFFANPLNYVAWGLHGLRSALWRLGFRLVGKDARIFTKKIAAVADR